MLWPWKMRRVIRYEISSQFLCTMQTAFKVIAVSSCRLALAMLLLLLPWLEWLKRLVHLYAATMRLSIMWYSLACLSGKTRHGGRFNSRPATVTTTPYFFLSFLKSSSQERGKCKKTFIYYEKLEWRMFREFKRIQSSIFRDKWDLFRMWSTHIWK